MKKQYFWIVPLAVLAAGAVHAEDAAMVWAAKCASCHGKTGKGNPAMAKVFKVEPVKLDMTAPETLAKSDEDLAKVTADGVAKMPAFKDKLTADEIKATIAYMRSLAPKDAAAAPAAVPAEPPKK